MNEAKHGGFRVFYSRPPFFMVLTASTAEQLAAKVAELDARMKDAPTEKANA
jgi:hypothetical protein